jgi:hypothetical protein
MFNVEKFYFIFNERTCMFFMYLRTNSDYFPLQHFLVGFYNGDDMCLLRGTSWNLMYNLG